MEFIVGTVLGGIPIVLEAYDRYWQLSSAFSTFRHSSTELMKLDTTLKTQMTLFRGNALNLLSAITKDPETAKDLISDTNSPKWAGITMHEEFRDRVDGLKDEISCWMATAMQIKLCLGFLCRELDGLQDITRTDLASTADSARNVLRRFNLAWKKPEILKAIRELREFTADHNDLTSRLVVGLQNVSATRHVGVSGANLQRTSDEALRRYRYIRDASLYLYNTLVSHWSCTCQIPHLANICLMKEGEDTSRENAISFELAIDTAQQLATSTGPVWLEVKLVDPASPVVVGSGDPSADRWVNQLREHSKPFVFHIDEKAPPRKLTKTMASGSATGSATSGKTFTEQASISVQVSHETMPSPSTTTAAFESLDLEKVGNFCTYFRKTASPCLAKCACPTCQGGGAHKFEKHHLLLQSGQRLDSGQPTSLNDIITWVAEDEISRSMSRMGILHLAAGLASAVLQFHSTPWLRENWQSHDVRFYGGEDVQSGDKSGLETSDPFLRIELEALTSARELHDESVSGLARNEMLFRLGIVMLELGYGKPWAVLRHLAWAKLSSRKQTDYHAAETLAKARLLREKMGPRYPLVVRKCLGCDFGLGENDLDNEELQGTYLSEVIMALRQAEADLRTLDQRLKGVK